MQEDFPTLIDQYHDRRDEIMPDTYDSNQISRFINEYVLSSLAKERQPNFENSLKKLQEKQSQSSSSSHWIITPIEWTYIYLVECITEIELEKLEATLRAIINEGEIMKNIQRLIYLDREIIQSKLAFEKAIQKLVKEIDDPHDAFLIKGKCEKCKEWNK